jgi:hypothetical protein
MNTPGYIITALALIALSIYLFVQAPSALPEEDAVSGELIPIGTVLRVVAAENDAVRALWTREIVGAGGTAGLAFNENWRDEDLEAGPLPALFLRLAATSLEKNPIPLSLFLGSDFPISPSNQFTGRQMEAFEQIRASGEPQFFLAEDTFLHTAMFADYASVEPCVACHNDHPDSPKTDWVLNDLMGATTWAYPKEAVTMDEFLALVAATRQGFREAYEEYLVKVATFDNPPEIGEQWPRDGYFLPTADVFLAEFEAIASARSMELILSTTDE